MRFDFSSLVRPIFVLMLLQLTFMSRWYVVRCAEAIRSIEKSHGSRVLTMIHRQEKTSLFGVAASPHIDIEDAQTSIVAIKNAF